MRETVTEAIVLASEPIGESDARVFLYTEALGAMRASAKSARKVTSKLTPHLQPLMRVTVRIAERNGVHIADALSRGRLPASQLPVLELIKESTFGGTPDPHLWAFLRGGGGTVSQALTILGLDPESATCVRCNSPEITHVAAREGVFVCARHAPAHPQDEGYIAIA